MDHKYIGTVSYQVIERDFGTAQWQPKIFYKPPFGQIITAPPMFLTAFGSAGISLPTSSPYDQKYIAAINILRQDYEFGKIVFDKDRYIIKPFRDYGIVFMEPPDTQHHLNLESELINDIDPKLQFYIRTVLAG